ncbi:protein pellino-like isoform X2 [Schistocerca gregaria]|uniref:protein pellino-like isoform X2 n=1 Tax=Schistocerca gregaria TaxID=7010 RepID=UPI00211F128C|nr:protein pellino-like isoform X2 [Schistocerca gregaria]
MHLPISMFQEPVTTALKIQHSSIPVAEKRRGDECYAPLLKHPRVSEPHGFIPQIIPYGTFYIVGYNGFKPPFNRGRVKSYCQIIRKYYGDGVKYVRTCIAKTPQVLKAALDSKSHNVIYKFSVSETVLVQYARDRETDMFQIGRSAEPPIDFVVMDVNRHAGRATSTVSRYACRVLADRKNCRDVRIFAAGFNEACNIFLGAMSITSNTFFKNRKLLLYLQEKAIKWHEEESVDGLTTNGVLLNHPQGDFWGGDAKPGCWREVSVNGKLYTLRPIRDSDVRGAPVQHETNLLQDGSLIDLCGATVIWRSADGLKKSITKDNLRQALSEESIFKCTGMCMQYKDSDSSTILSSSGSMDSQKKCLPHVYFKCGHVQTCVDTTRNYAACPVCLEYGPTARLSLGIEAAFYVDRGPLQYAFNPCGHIANKKTVEYWSSIKLPNRKSSFEAKCPFCEATLAKPVGYVQLKQMT